MVQHSGDLPISHVTAAMFYQPPWVNDCALDYMNGDVQRCKRPGLNVEMFVLMSELMRFTFDVKVGQGMGAFNQTTGDYGKSNLIHFYLEKSVIVLQNIFYQNPKLGLKEHYNFDFLL